MSKLIANIPILFENRMYQPGEAVPASDPAYIAALKEAGSVKIQDDEKSATLKLHVPDAPEKPKAPIEQEKAEVPSEPQVPSEIQVTSELGKPEAPAEVKKPVGRKNK